MSIVRATSVDHASDLLREAEAEGLNARVIGGGTALMLLKRTGYFRPELLVSLRDLRPQLAGVTQVDGGWHRVGAMTTLEELRSSPVTVQHDAVRQALERLANVRVRHAATIGGHLAHADPHMDLPAVLMALGAQVLTAGASSGPRSLGVEQLITGYYETCLEPGELITAVDIPVTAPDQRSTYEKFTFLGEDDWPSVGVAAVHGRPGAAVCLVASAISDRPLRLTAAEERLASGGWPARAEAAALAAQDVEPTSDLHGSAAYKRQMLQVMVRRAVETVLQPTSLGDDDGI